MADLGTDLNGTIYFNIGIPVCFYGIFSSEYDGVSILSMYSLNAADKAVAIVVGRIYTIDAELNLRYSVISGQTIRIYYSPF